MRVATTIALPEDLLATIDRQSKEYGGLSQLVEAAVRAFLGHRSQDALDVRDLEIIDRHADELNREAADALEYQVPL